MKNKNKYGFLLACLLESTHPLARLVYITMSQAVHKRSLMAGFSLPGTNSGLGPVDPEVPLPHLKLK